MPYDDAWIRRVGAPSISPIWVLDTVRLAGLAPPGGTWRIASPGVPGIDGLIDRVSVAPSVLQVPGWDSTIGTITLDIVGDLRGTIGEIARGQVVRLRMGLAGDSEGAWADIAVGYIASIERQGLAPQYTMTIRDLGGILGRRPSRTSGALFSDLTSTTSAATYTAGDATLTVTATTGFERETGGSYMVKVTPSSGATPFYLTATGTAAGPARFTGVSATGQLGTTAVNAASGSTVQEVAYIYDHPARAALKILASTGTGTNGAYDTLPGTWGYGIPSWLLDGADVERTVTQTKPASVSTGWRLWSTAAVDDPEEWIRSILGAGGFFPCFYRGKLTIRPAWHPYTKSVALQLQTLRPVVARISEMDLAVGDSVSWSAWSDDAQEAGTVRVRSRTGSSTVGESYTTSPGIGQVDYDARLWIHDSETTWRESIRDRVAVWHLRIPEVLRVKLAGLQWIGIGVGDCIEVSSDILHGRTRTTDTGYQAQRMIVTTVGVDWAGLTVSLTLACISNKANDFG